MRIRATQEATPPSIVPRQRWRKVAVAATAVLGHRAGHQDRVSGTRSTAAGLAEMASQETVAAAAEGRPQRQRWEGPAGMLLAARAALAARVKALAARVGTMGREETLALLRVVVAVDQGRITPPQRVLPGKSF